MPRADWDITVDIYSGPSAGVPNVYLSTRQARVVPAVRGALKTPASLFPTFYITHSGTRLSAGTTITGAGFIQWNHGLANRVEIPSGSGVFWTVSLACLVLPRITTLPSYSKAWLVP